MLRLAILFSTFVLAAFTNTTRINCEGRKIDWHILDVEEYHKGMNLTFDCFKADTAAWTAYDELSHPSIPQHYVNSTEYCRYSRQMTSDSATFTKMDLKLLLEKMLKEAIMKTAEKLGPTTYGCSARGYEYPRMTDCGNHAHLELLCLYRKHNGTQECLVRSMGYQTPISIVLNKRCGLLKMTH